MRVETERNPASTDADATFERLLKVVEQSLDVRSHGDFLAWLQGRFQALVPHDILVVAWGDLSLGTFSIDLTSSLPDVRTRSVPPAELQAFVRDAYERWIDGAHAPLRMTLPTGLDVATSAGTPHAAFAGMRHALVHGIRSQRDSQVCLHVLLHSRAFPAGWEGSLRMLVPFIDAALRQIEPLPTQRTPSASAFAAEWDLSDREGDILQWVANGKTNQEIGLIMDISPFTVKNHLRRIFQKLDVSNRAQAVDKLSRCPPRPLQARP